MLLTFSCEGLSKDNQIEQSMVKACSFGEAAISCEKLANQKQWELYSFHFVSVAPESDLALLNVC